MSQWKKVKARKDYQCQCCGGEILNGEDYFQNTEWTGSRFPQISRYCLGCGTWVKQGYSFREARIKAFGSPLLRGWIRP